MRSIGSSNLRGRWVALLVSMHMSFLNASKHGELPELDKFLDKQIELQTAWRKSLKVLTATKNWLNRCNMRR